MLLLFVCGFVVSLFVWWPMLVLHPHTPELDGHQFLFMLEIGRAPILKYHELPLWNPFDCHGMPSWDHPENITASPLFFLTLPLSGLLQYYAFILFHSSVGFVGMWILARDDVKLSRTASFVAAASFTLAASQTFQVAGGHITFAGFWCFPLALYMWRAAENDVRWAVGLGLLLAWMIFHGATYPTPFCSLALIFEGATRLGSLRKIGAIVKAGVVTGVTALSVSAVRLLPLADQFRSHVRPNPYPDVDHTTAKNVWAMLTLRTLDWSSHLPGSQYVWNEYVAYVGFAGIALIIIGAFLATHRAPWVVILGGFLLLVMVGHFAKWAPWSILNHHVFPYTSMRVPSRFRLVLATPFALCLAIAVEDGPKALLRLTGKPKIADTGRALLLGFALIAVGDAVGFGISKVQMHFNGAPPALVVRSDRFYYGGAGLSSDFADVPRQNRGWLGCRLIEWVFHQGAPVWTGDVPQARAADASVVVESVSRTNNTFSLEVEVTADRGKVLLNSGYDASWQTTVGTVVAEGDLLALEVPRGHHTIHMQYRPKKLVPGAILSALGLGGAIAFLVLVSRRRRRA